MGKFNFAVEENQRRLTRSSLSTIVQRADRRMKQQNAPTCARLEIKSSRLRSHRATGQRTALSGVVVPAPTVAVAILTPSRSSWRRFWVLYRRAWSARVPPRHHLLHRQLRRRPHLRPRPRHQQQRTQTVPVRVDSVEEQ